MDAGTLVKRAYTVFRGKVASKTPAFGTDKAAIVLEIANGKVTQWAQDSNQVWASLFKSDETSVNETGTVATTGSTTLTGTNTFFTDFRAGDTILVSGETVRTIDSITSDTVLIATAAFTNTASTLTFSRRPIIVTAVQEYSIPRNFFVPSDKIIVTISSGDIPYKMAKPQRRDTAGVYISNINPKKLTFYDDIVSANQIVGGTLKIPGYYIPTDMVATTDLVAVDSPEWLVIITAAELSRNDSAKSDQFSNLIGMANDLYEKMIVANINIGFGNSGEVPNLMPQIGDQTDMDGFGG